MVYEFLADGYEIVEAMAPVDILRRANIEVKTVGITGKTVFSSCGIPVIADITAEELDMSRARAIILPGGGPGTEKLEKSPVVRKAVIQAVEKKIPVCAICAAPSILGHMGLLAGKEAICFPGFEGALSGAKLSDRHVVTDGTFITAKGAGVAVDFGLEIVKALCGETLAAEIRETIQCR